MEKKRITEIISEISQLIESGKFNQSAIAKAVGVSGSQLSQFLGNKYPGKVEPLVKGLESFLQNQKDKKEITHIRIPFIESNFTNRIIEGARMCHLDNEIGVCVGDAGMQKTWSLKEYCRQHPESILIETDPGYTAKALFEDLMRILGCPEVTGIHNMFDKAVEKLIRSDRFLMIDETENLGHRALELLRRLHDKAGIGLYLVGMPRLISNLRGKKGEYAQLYSRVSLLIHLNNYRDQLLRESPEMVELDAQAFIQALIPNCNGKWRRVYEMCGFNARVLVKISKRINRLAENNSGHVTEEIISRAQKMLIF